MKKALSLALVMAILCLLGVTAMADSTSEEPLNCKYLMPGNPPPDLDLVLPLINEKLMTDSNMTVEPVYIPWDVWDQTINLKLATNEEFDLFHVMQTGTTVGNYYSMGGLADITDSMEKEGQAILAHIPSDMIEAAEIDGRLYTIPAFWIELGVEGIVTIRKDLFELSGAGMPTGPDDLIDKYKIVQQYWADNALGSAPAIYLPFVADATADPLTLHTTSLHNTYDRYPFMVKDMLIYVGQDGTIESWLETDEFRMDCEWMRRAYEEGVIDPDILTLTYETIQSTMFQPSNWAVFFGTGAGSVESMQTYFPGMEIDETTVGSIRFNTEKPTLRPWAFKNCNSVPASSKNTDAPIRFLNWMYQSQENYDLWMYGIEGTHYEALEGNSKKTLFTDWTAPGAYAQSDWMMGNLNLIRTESGSFTEEREACYVLDPSIENSIAAGFYFDPSPVLTKQADVHNAYAESMVPIIMGVQDYETYFDDALAKLKLAGLDDVVAEYKDQLEAYIEIL